MRFGHISRVSQLPRIEIKRSGGKRIKVVRGFNTWPASQLRKISKALLREGIAMSEAARKTGIPLEELYKFGVSERGIFVRVLEDALKMEIPREFKWRIKEARTLDRAFEAVTSRLGEERIVLMPFDLLSSVESLEKKGVSVKNEIIALVRADFKASGLKLHGKDGYIARIARALYPDEEDRAKLFIEAAEKITRRK